MVGDIAPKWLLRALFTVAGIAISGATTWSYLREFLGTGSHAYRRVNSMPA
jgi:hypothetical protein